MTALVVESAQELQELFARRPAGIRQLFRRYILGRPTEKALTPDELKKKVGWEDKETEINERRVRIARDELMFTMEGLREQFAKVASIIALFALLLAFNLSDNTKGKTVAVVAMAAIVAIWVQSPRLKIFGFRKRPDSGVRIGAVKTTFDEYYYWYSWLNRREETLHAAEVLVFQTTVIAVLALVYVGTFA